ncbi:unnamed protein product [Thelazia callipaeda]|uniref:Small integral membrane protein 6 n=1 Tax=Thelazia callipaeda TaxID=103827 RepID=A0A0N5CJT9_THECL|nr:unnamed protein product [Thelazia callipaeda]
MGVKHEDLGPRNASSPSAPLDGAPQFPKRVRAQPGGPSQRLGTSPKMLVKALPREPGVSGKPCFSAPNSLGGEVSRDRTELKSASVGAPGVLESQNAVKVQIPKKALVSMAVDYEEEERKYTGAQKMCMVISGIMAVFFLMTVIASVVILVTGFKIFT